MATRAKQDHAFKHWRLDTDLDQIAWLYLDRSDEKANSLSSEVLGELERLVEQLEQDHPAGLVLMSGKPKSFIVGADIREFDASDDVDELRDQVRRVHRLFQRIEDLPFPTAVAIEGYCLGGGLEIALCFDYRIALDAEHTRIGFPEVNLGIYPGFGGSGRSIDTLGGLKAMQIMLTGKMLRARAAKSMGLVDQLIGSHGSLRWAARNAVLQQRKSRRPGLFARATRWAPLRKLLSAQMRKQTAARARREHYPAPYELIDAYEQSGHSCAEMIQIEADKVPALLAGDTSRNLRRVFRLMEGLKDHGKRSNFKARRVHVIGAGVMGGDIAAWCAASGLEVTLQDRDMKFIDPAIKRAESLFRRRFKTAATIAAARSRLIADVDGHGIRRADVIIEAIFEDREAKRELFARLDKEAPRKALLATNTSAIPLADLADVLDKPGRLIGLHFFNPVARMPLVEVIHDPGLTNQKHVNDGSSFAGQIGKYPLPASSSPGFLVNRVLAPYMRNAMKMHREGIPKEALDQAAMQFGMPMGPVELADTVGLDVGLGVIRTLAGDDAGEERKVLEQMVESGKLGKKSGEGFYHWKNGKPQRDKEAHKGHELDRLAEQLMQPYFDECQACLADGVVSDADQVDAGMIFGTGFAPFRGGPMHYLESGSASQASSPANKEHS